MEMLFRIRSSWLQSEWGGSFQRYPIEIGNFCHLTQNVHVIWLNECTHTMGPIVVETIRIANNGKWRHCQIVNFKYFFIRFGIQKVPQNTIKKALADSSKIGNMKKRAHTSTFVHVDLMPYVEMFVWTPTTTAATTKKNTERKRNANKYAFA